MTRPQAKNYQGSRELEEARRAPSSIGSRGSVALSISWFLSSSLQNYENTFPLFKSPGLITRFNHPVLPQSGSTLLWQLQGTNTPSVWLG